MTANLSNAAEHISDDSEGAFTMPFDHISDHAHSVSAAHAVVQRATADLATVHADYQVVADRISAIDADRSAIIARRQHGDSRPGDAGTVELLAADRQGLEAILAEREAEVTKAKAALAAARQALVTAQREMQRSEDEVTHAALKEHASKLDALLLATVTQIGEVRTRLGEQRSSWTPSAALYRELRKLVSVAGGL